MTELESTSRLRILLMDGDLAGSARMCAKLTLAGWHVIQVADPVEALAAVRSEPPDLVLLRLPVNEMAGMDLPNVVRSVASTAYLPVIILGDSPQEHQRCDFLDCGADDVLSTELSVDELLARIRALLRIKGLHDQLAASGQALQEALERERDLLARLRRDNAHLQSLCTIDPLTRVQNVRSFGDILRHEYRMAKRYDQPLSLLVIDVDHFKVFNDTYGHPAGDYVLKELAVVLKRSVRESDVVARTGGEEFAVVLPRADRRRAAILAERVRNQAAAHLFNVYGQTLRVTISVGFASYPADAEITEPEMLVYFADQALLTAKESGRDRVVAFGGLSREVRNRHRRQYFAARQAVVQPAPADEPAVRS